MEKIMKTEAVEDNGYSYKNFALLVGGALAVFFLAIFHNQPWTIDILQFWQKHLQGFLEIFSYSIHYGNGRLLGNIGTFYLIYYPTIGLIIRVSFLAALPFLICRALDIKSKIILVTTVLLILLVSPIIYGQCYGWICGFQNYVPGIVLFLIAVILVRESNSGARLFLRILRILLICLCGISMQLYVEHTSIYNLFCSAFLMIAYLHRKQNVTEAGVLFMSALFGELCMLLIPHFFTIGSIVSGYRSTYFSAGLTGIFFGTVKNGSKLISMFSENSVALFGLALLVCLLISRLNTSSLRIRGMLKAGMLIPSGCFLIIQPMALSSYYGRLAVYESAALVFLFLVYSCCGLIAGVMLIKYTPDDKIKLAMFLFVASLGSMVPLLFVEPIPARCLLHGYLFLCGAVIVYMDYALSAGIFPSKVPLLTKNAAKESAIILASVMLCQLFVFSDIRRMGKIREEYIAEQASNGQTQADYFMIPSKYVYDFWDERHYRLYYAERYGAEMEIHLLPADQWFRDHYYFY